MAKINGVIGDGSKIDGKHDLLNRQLQNWVVRRVLVAGKMYLIILGKSYPR